MENILEIKNISKSFDSKGNIYIIKNFDLNVKKNRVTSLIGGNGTGKTTLFNIISGFLNSSGNIYFNNKKQIKINKLKPHKREQLGIGRLFQGNNIFPELTVLENLLVAYVDDFGESPLHVLFNPKKTKIIEKKRIEKAFDVLENILGVDKEIFEKRNELANDISYGQQRLVQLARLFMSNYKILLLDEPTAGLNQFYIDKVELLISKMVNDEDMTILLIEHNMNFVKNVSDYCAYMTTGKIKYFDTPEIIINKEEVRKSYLGL